MVCVQYIMSMYIGTNVSSNAFESQVLHTNQKETA